jgi:hypothetical protein
VPLDAGTLLAFDAPMSSMPTATIVRASRTLFALAFAIRGAGCNIQPLTTTSGSDSGAAQTTAQFCLNSCTAQSKCDSSVVMSSCQSGCASTYGPSLAHRRADWVAALSTCLKAATCGSWQSGLALTSCQDQAAAAITPSSTAQSYCTQAVAKDTACGNAGTETPASCAEIVKSIDDGSLNTAMGCFGQDCGQYSTCVHAATGY